MSEHFGLQKHQTRTIASEESFTGARTVNLTALSGPRMLVTLSVTAIDPATEVSVSVQNGFEASDYSEIGAVSRTSTGRTSTTVSDYHAEFSFVITVTGGNATFKVGITTFDGGAVDVTSSAAPEGTATEATLVEVRDRLGDIKGFVDGLEALSASIESINTQIAGSVDGLEGLNTQIRDAVDNIEPLLTAISGYVDGLEGFTDGIEGKQDAGNASLSSIDGKLTTANTSLAAIEGKLAGMAGDDTDMTGPAQSTTPAEILPANVGRKMFTLYNNSASKVYVAFNATVSSTSFSICMAPRGYYESGAVVYRGSISAVWAAVGSGNMQITEVT